MQQFTVPQFIDVEGKIIGPITARQFGIMTICFILIAVYYKTCDFTLFLFLSLISFGLGIVFAFIKVNGMPFHFFILNFTQTWRRPGLRVWNNAGDKSEVIFEKDESDEMKKMALAPAKRITTSRLTELSLIVDTQGIYRGEEKEE